MSEENVELVRQCLNRWIEVDEGLADVDRLYEFFAEDALFVSRDLPDTLAGRSDVLHGIDEFLQFRAAWIGSFDDWSYCAEQILDAGGNTVVGTFRQRGKLRGSDDWIDMRYAIVYTIEKGLITGGRLYVNREEGLEAAGLSEYRFGRKASGSPVSSPMSGLLPPSPPQRRRRKPHSQAAERRSGPLPPSE
jgi:ketosteroid isomerase-like protein